MQLKHKSPVILPGFLFTERPRQLPGCFYTSKVNPEKTVRLIRPVLAGNPVHYHQDRLFPIYHIGLQEKHFDQ